MNILAGETAGTTAYLPPTEQARVRAAAREARRRYPGVVGDVLADELTSWEAFGFRFGYGRVAALLDHLTT